MDPIITKRATERERNAGVQPPAPAPLLDSPLPTPRRSCASFDASRTRLRCRGDASPLRNHVPFSWESSPGVPKNKKAPAATMPPPPPPRPPPGRLQPPCLATNSYYYSNTSEASSDDDDRSFSDALDRISSPERTGSFDRDTSKRFEDIFVGRATSFAKDRSSRHDNQAAKFSATARHPRQQPRRGRGHDEEDGRRWTPRLLNDNVPMQLMQRIRMDAEAEEMTPRACGLMVFFPWRAKPAVCGFRGIPAPAPAASQHATATPRPGGAGAPSSRSHSRRITTSPATTLRDVIKEDKEADSGDLPQQQRGEKKRVREDLQPSRRWGVSSLLDTSKKYCTDARKALSKLSIGLGADSSGTPRVGSSERMRSGKLHNGFSSTPATPAKLTHLKANRN
ncbi:unnamed protein product [Urochloa decumbens]|uniref:Uncharacterized protein n=1 Tax=Urochloa decumbens TaxID=240449 RepID=A0ABC8Z4N9_9POAL